MSDRDEKVVVRGVVVSTPGLLSGMGDETPTSGQVILPRTLLCRLAERRASNEQPIVRDRRYAGSTGHSEAELAIVSQFRYTTEERDEKEGCTTVVR
jgi:hypothetical protein